MTIRIEDYPITASSCFVGKTKTFRSGTYTVVSVKRKKVPSTYKTSSSDYVAIMARSSNGRPGTSIAYRAVDYSPVARSANLDAIFSRGTTVVRNSDGTFSSAAKLPETPQVTSFSRDENVAVALPKTEDFLEQLTALAKVAKTNPTYVSLFKNVASLL